MEEKNTKKNNTVSIRLSLLAQTIFLALKVTDVIKWKWSMVLIPLYIYLAVEIIDFIICLIRLLKQIRRNRQNKEFYNNFENYYKAMMEATQKLQEEEKNNDNSDGFR